MQLMLLSQLNIQTKKEMIKVLTNDLETHDLNVATVDLYSDLTFLVSGLKGDKGDKGDSGYTPIKGIDYFDGVKGDKGDKGEKGDKGDQGIQGLKGDKGDQGIQGIQGQKGDKGDAGTTDYNELENKPDLTQYVSKTETETISGEKTFSQKLHINSNNNGVSNSGILDIIISNPANLSFPITTMCPKLDTEQSIYWSLGKTNTLNNKVSFGYNHIADKSNENNFSIAFYGQGVGTSSLECYPNKVVSYYPIIADTFKNSNNDEVAYQKQIPTKVSQLENDSKYISHCSHFFAKGDGEVTIAWHCTIPEITEYYEGMTILFYINMAGGTGTTLQVNELDPIPCYFNATTALTTHYAVGCIIPLTYIVENEVAKFKIADYNKDTTYNVVANEYWHDSGLVDESSVDLSSACLFGRLGNRNLCGLTLTTGTGTAKKGSTQGFDLDHDSIYYSVEANAKGTYKTRSGGYRNTGIDARYAVDKSSFVLNSKTYLVFTKGEDGLFYLNKPTATTVATFGDNWWWNDTANGFPTDEASITKAQGLYFFELGMHYGGTSNRSIGFSSDHHIFYYDSNGNIKIYK